MKPFLILPFLLLIFLNCTSKKEKILDTTIENVSPTVLNPNNYDEIGFQCNYEGKSTDIVSKFSNLIKDKNYYQLKSELYSSQPGNCYLATFICEKLVEEGLINLNGTEMTQIKKNRTKTDTIFTCSGCTNSGNFTIKQLLTDTSNFMRMETGWWFDEMFGKNVIGD